MGKKVISIIIIITTNIYRATPLLKHLQCIVSLNPQNKPMR